MTICRFGILGTATIARKNWKAIRLSDNACVTAVASRQPAKAQAFIDECSEEVPPGGPVAAVSYEDLLKREDVDAVYIPLPTGIRAEWVQKAARAGKHVLCEKPCGSNLGEVLEMVSACKAANVQFMDGVMFMHSGRLPLVRQVLDDGTSVGNIRRITSQFSFAAPPEFLTGNIRADHALEPLGCLGDLGWYNSRLTLFVMDYQMPEKVSGRLLLGHGQAGKQVPLEFSAELFFHGGVTASFFNSFRTQHQQWAHISGDKGWLSIPDFVLPYQGCESSFEVNNAHFHIAGCSFHMQGHPRRFAAIEQADGAPDSQETSMIRTFSTLALSGKPDPFWGDIAIKTQNILDALVKSAAMDGALVTV
jgi:predicted dehydrogenase